MEALGSEIDEQLATTDCENLLSLSVLQAENIKDNLHAYQLAKRCNVKRVMAEAVKWGKKKARINSISPGIIVTPLAIDEFNGKRGAFYKNMFAKAPAGRPGTADEVANVAETNKPATEPNKPVVEKKVIDKPQKKAAPVIDEESNILSSVDDDDFIPIEDLPSEKIELPTELFGKFEATKTESAQTAANFL